MSRYSKLKLKLETRWRLRGRLLIAMADADAAVALEIDDEVRGQVPGPSSQNSHDDRPSFRHDKCAQATVFVRSLGPSEYAFSQATISSQQVDIIRGGLKQVKQCLNLSSAAEEAGEPYP